MPPLTKTGILNPFPIFYSTVCSEENYHLNNELGSKFYMLPVIFSPFIAYIYSFSFCATLLIFYASMSSNRKRQFRPRLQFGV